MKSSVIVTGASSGIGAEIARQFSKENYFVFLCGRNEEKLKSVQKTCVNNTAIMAFDLKNLKEYEPCFHEQLKSAPPLEILVNNAGIYHLESFSETADQIWLDQFNVNLLAPVQLVKLVWPLFVKNRKGSILNISSTLGIKPIPNTSAYSAMKAAMNNWTIALAQEGGPYNIRANSICPGIVDTPIHSFHNLDTKEKKIKSQIL